MNRFFRFCALFGLLAGCATTQNKNTGKWNSMVASTPAGTPTTMQYGVYAGDNVGERRIAVLLPTSGKNAKLGQSIRTSIEMTTLASNMPGLSVSFHDTSDDTDAAITSALATNPGIIIGPVFADDVRALGMAKPADLPALTFTSDATAVGNGIMTMALMPTNGIEAIVREMSSDGARSFIIIAPDTASGHMMAGIARRAGEINDIATTGIFFYQEKNAESIKTTTQTASMNAARTAANNRARAILSDILTTESLTPSERASINRQLENLSRAEVVGKLPYDAILFLGGGDDTKSAASFLRYFGVSARDAAFYGTALWDGSDIASDFTMTGAKFAALPPTNEEFASVYERLSGGAPTRLAGFGYDAANLAIGMLYSQTMPDAYLLNPSGYVGTDGLIRLRPTGDNERGMRIMRLNGDGTPTVVRDAPADFITPIYNIEQRHITPALSMPLATTGVNPINYITIPERLRGKYRATTYGASFTTPAPTISAAEKITVNPEDDSDVIQSPDYRPQKLDTVTRTYIDSVEIEE